MDAPKSPGGHFAEKWLIFREAVSPETTPALKGLDFLQGLRVPRRESGRDLGC
jgi:hypothetical protein